MTRPPLSVILILRRPLLAANRKDNHRMATRDDPFESSQPGKLSDRIKGTALFLGAVGVALLAINGLAELVCRAPGGC